MIGSGDWCVSVVPNPDPHPVSAVASTLVRPRLRVDPFRLGPDGKEFELVPGPNEFLGREKESADEAAVSQPGWSGWVNLHSPLG